MKFYLNALFFFSVLLLSCESEEESVEISAEITGAWQLEALIFDGARESLTSCELMQSVEFLPSETTTYYWIAEPPCEFANFEGTYVFEGEKLGITLSKWNSTSGTYTANYKVRLLNENSLRLELLNDSERGDYSDAERTILVFDRLPGE